MARLFAAIGFERKRRDALALTGALRRVRKELAMTYRIAGLDPQPFAPLFEMNDDDLRARRARRVIADADRGFPCRVSLADAQAGEALILLNHEHHSADSPYRGRHAIYVRESATAPAVFHDALPPAFDGRVLSLRGFDADGMIVRAALAQPGEADAVIRAVLEDPVVTHVDAHNAARGCFAARIEREETPA
jgi:hypothetical protein